MTILRSSGAWGRTGRACSGSGMDRGAGRTPQKYEIQEI